MKKVLMLLLVIIISTAIVGPKIVGSQLDDGIHNMVNNINHQGAYTATLNNIETNWFSTTADVTLALNMPDMSALGAEETIDMSVDLVITAQHGPVITDGGLAIAWLRSHVVTKNSQLPNGLVLKTARPIYEFNGVTGLLGTTSYQDSIAALDYTAKDIKATLSFSGMHGEGSFSNNGVKYTGNTDLMTMNMPNAMSINIERMGLVIDSADSINIMMTQGLYNATSSMSMDIMTWNDMVNGTEARIIDAHLFGTSDYNDDSGLGGIEIKTTAASIDLPNTNITDLNTLVEVKNLQAKFLLAYQDFTNKMLRNNNDPQQVGGDLKSFMDTHLLSQLQANPEYNISELSGKINGSQFNGKIMTKLEGVTTLPDTLEDPRFWIEHAEVDSKIVLQKGAAEFVATKFLATQLAANSQFASMSPEQQAQIIEQQVGSTLTALTQQGMLKMNGEDYEFIFTLHNASAELNGNTIPL